MNSIERIRGNYVDGACMDIIPYIHVTDFVRLMRITDKI